MFKHIAYPAIFTKDGNYICVDFPDLEGCLTQGETIEEAYFAAKEALALYLDTVGECPPPSAVEAVKPSDGEFVMLVEPHAEGEILDAKEVDVQKILNECLEKSGYSKYKVAQIMGISESYVNFIFSGKRKPSPQIAQRMGTLLNFDWRIFYTPKAN